MNKFIKNLVLDFISLFYPSVCAACNRVLMRHERLICSYCEVEMPKTFYHSLRNNPLEEVFWGRIKIEAAAARYFFRKKGKTQHLMHNFKYKGMKEIGVIIGEDYGQELITNPIFKSVDVVIPIPLHPKKKKIRGYNQSEMFAIGLSNSMGIPMDITSLIRTVATSTQTRKSRFMRWENVKEIFKITDEKALENKHILLVDDIITTGATIEGAAQMLMQINGVKISVAGMACTII